MWDLQHLYITQRSPETVKNHLREKVTSHKLVKQSRRQVDQSECDIRDGMVDTYHNLKIKLINSEKSSRQL